MAGKPNKGNSASNRQILVYTQTDIVYLSDLYKDSAKNVISGLCVIIFALMKVRLKEIAKWIDARIEGDENIEIVGPSKIEEGFTGALTFLGNPKYEPYIYHTKASAVLVPEEFRPKRKVSAALVRVKNVYEALGILLEKAERKLIVPQGVDPTAVIHESARVHESASIGPLVVISEGAEVEEGVVLHAQVYIGPYVKIGAATDIRPGVRIMHDCQIGRQCLIHANAVIGSDGFGFSQSQNGEFEKVSQTGGVLIEDKVEIGANVTIDRATMGVTHIQSGAKIDNLVQIAHNVVVGKNTAIAAQAGVAGSTTIGPQSLIGGQVGIVGHLNLPKGTQIQAQSGVTKSPQGEGQKLYGSPAIAYGDFLRSYVAFQKMPSYLMEIKHLQKRIKELEDKVKE